MTEQNGVKKNYCSWLRGKIFRPNWKMVTSVGKIVFITRFVLPFTEIDASYRRRTQFKASLDMTFQLCL